MNTSPSNAFSRNPSQPKLSPDAPNPTSSDVTRRPSVTARIVCAARGVGVSDSLRDPSASALSSGWVASALRWFETPSALSGALRLTLRTLSLGIVDHNTVRMAVVDQYVRDWVSQGCRQLVILGAGLDARAFRMPELASVDVFEVDHATSQQWKQQRAARLTKRSKSLSFAVADFCHDGLGAALANAGFKPELPTAWVCEGVAAYLDVASIARLLQVVSHLSAPGSLLAMSYVAPSTKSNKSSGELGTSKDGLAARLAAQLGEPARGWLDADGMQHLVQTAGLHAQEDITWQQWLDRVPQYRPSGTNLLKERLVVAKKGVQN